MLYTFVCEILEKKLVDSDKKPHQTVCYPGGNILKLYRKETTGLLNNSTSHCNWKMQYTVYAYRRES